MSEEIDALLAEAPGLEVHLVDVYEPGAPGPIHDWIQAIVAGTVPAADDAVRHWVHVRDAERAIRRLVDAGVEGEFHLCGRRAWTQAMVVDELQHLWERLSNTLAHSHTVDSLSNTPSPAAVAYEGERRRPDLGPLHDALLACGTDGWRPMIAMRTGLMECIALSSGLA